MDIVEQQVADYNRYAGGETMSEPIEETRAYMATGRNPHYKPPLNRWRTVEIMAPAGCLVGVVLDSEPSAALVIVVHQGREWSSEMDLEEGHVAHLMSEERRFFRVQNDERSPAVDHEFAPDPDDPRRCTVCGCDGGGAPIEKREACDGEP